jgi:phosphoenolpyruvate-protein kinase (PTS system EI component)
MQKAFQFGADGVGLFRTEMCFLESKNFPTEESHFQKYTSILKEFPKALHTIRLLDFGSDKPLVYLKNKIEENPALGSRALRLGFEYYKELLKPQLRALLRLSQQFNLQLLCPMIADIEDLLEIKEKINLEFHQLINEGFEIRKIPSIGIMVEIPNIILQPQAVAKKADFFSFGTNDLAQFLMAADRTNDRVTHYLPRAKESLLFLIENFTKVAHEEGKKVSVCGELASDEECLSTFIRIGIDSLSMPPNLIPGIKEAIRNSP